MKEKKKIYKIDELKDKKEEKNKRKKEKKKKFARVKLCVFLLLLTAAILIIVPVFKISWIDVSGNNLVKTSEIKTASTLNVGENLLGFNIKRTKNKIKKIPYIDEVHILRWMPGGVKIKVTERTPLAAIKNKDLYYIIDEDGRIVEISKQTSLSLVENIKPEKLKAGDFVDEKYKEELQGLKAVVDMVKNCEMGDRLATVGIDKKGNYTLIVDKNKNVILGDTKRIDYKLEMLKSVTNELSPIQEGTIDLSKEGQALFSPKK